MKKATKALAVVPKTPHIEHVEQKKKVAHAIIPKPTRAEVVEALVLKKYQEWVQERTKLAEDIRTSKAALEEIVRVELKAKPEILATAAIDTGYGESITVKMELKFNKWSGVVQEAYRTYKKLDERRQAYRHDFDKAQVRREMQEALRCDPARVGALAASPEIEATLRHIEANRPKPVMTLKAA